MLAISVNSLLSLCNRIDLYWCVNYLLSLLSMCVFVSVHTPIMKFLECKQSVKHVSCALCNSLSLLSPEILLCRNYVLHSRDEESRGSVKLKTCSHSHCLYESRLGLNTGPVQNSSHYVVPSLILSSLKFFSGEGGLG